MESSSIKRIIEKLTSSSPKHVYNALVQIRTKIIKKTGGVTFLVREEAIPKLIQLLRKDDQLLKGTSDLVLSILGNLCMVEEARENVRKNGGVQVIAEFFCASESESIQNRGCRTLANLALSPSVCEDIHQTEATSKIVKLLNHTESKECKLTYCRAIRLLGKTSSQIEKLIDENAVSSVSELLACDDDELKRVGLRALFELSISRCSPGFANQVVGAGIIKQLMNFISCEDTNVSHHSFITICKLIDQPDFRPPFGAAGGITLFIQLLDSDMDKDHRVSVINVLCLCSKEVVNRSKIRENSGLLKFLHCLQDDEMHVVHDRIISALLCYIYDEQSIKYLLENEMVKILIHHLQRVAEFKSQIEDIELCKDEDDNPHYDGSMESDESLMEDKECDTSHTQPVNKETENNSDKTNSGLHKPKISITPAREKITDDTDKITSKMDDRHCRMQQTTQRNVKKSSIVIDQSDTEKSESDEPEIKPSRKTHVFSIDSPTYEVNTEWNFDNAGIKSKQNFSETFDMDSSTLSPLSTISYFSPNISSPDYSPSHSPCHESPLNNDQDYPFVCSTPYYLGSPEKRKSSDALSPMGYSPVSSGFPQEYVYSDSEDDDSVSTVCSSSQNRSRRSKDPDFESIQEDICKVQDNETNDMEIERKNCADISETGETSSRLTKTEAKKLLSENFPCSADTDTVLKSTLKQLVRKKRSNSSPELHMRKRRKVVTISRNSPVCTEIHISMILSIASQVTDPSKYLVTMEAVCCFLDYLSDVDKPETRIARILSRLVRNPNCFEKFIHMNLPLLVFKKLLAGYLEIEDLGIVKAILNKFPCDHSGVRLGQRSRSSSVSSTSSDLSLLDLEDCLLNEIQPLSDNFGHGKTSTSTTIRKEERKASLSGLDTAPVTEGMNLRVKVGLSLLHDLFVMTNSPFGRGIIAHWFAKKEEAKKLQCAVCLLYIAWYSGMQQYYFFKLKILDDVLQILIDEKPVRLYNATLSGLVFLGKMLNLNLKLKANNLAELFRNGNNHGKLSGANQNEIKCVYASNINGHNLTIKVSGNSSSVNHNNRLTANRETLVKTSPMFEAMLEGHYSESKQSEILISQTSYYAVRYIIHYFHGCDLDCKIMNDLLTCDSTNDNLHHALEVLSLAHRYMLTELYHFLQTVICTRFLSHHNACIIYEFSTLHGFEDLAVDAVKSIFLERSEDKSVFAIKKCLKGPNGKLFIDSVKNLLKSVCS